MLVLIEGYIVIEGQIFAMSISRNREKIVIAKRDLQH